MLRQIGFHGMNGTFQSYMSEADRRAPWAIEVTMDPLKALYAAQEILSCAEPEYERNEEARSAFWTAQTAADEAIRKINEVKFGR